MQMQTKLDYAVNRISSRKLRTVIYILAFMAIGFALPWWSILIIAALIGWFEEGLLRSSIAALTACFIAWFLLSFIFDAMNGFRISTRIGGLVGLPVPVFANIVTATLGGLVAAFTAATANQLRIIGYLSRARR